MVLFYYFNPVIDFQIELTKLIDYITKRNDRQLIFNLLFSTTESYFLTLRRSC